MGRELRRHDLLILNKKLSTRDWKLGDRELVD